MTTLDRRLHAWWGWRDGQFQNSFVILKNKHKNKKTTKTHCYVVYCVLKQSSMKLGKKVN